jgi:phage protein D
MDVVAAEAAADAAAEQAHSLEQQKAQEAAALAASRLRRMRAQRVRRLKVPTLYYPADMPSNVSQHSVSNDKISCIANVIRLRPD